MNESIEYHEQFMQRCLDLAVLGAGHVAPNPMVGAVIVCEGKIIGEGYHQQYGEAHAEVNAVNQVFDSGMAEKLASSAMYVSLEPCVHFGKTPPCAELIIRHKIPRVVVGCRDPFKEVDGKGIEKLRASGIEVITGILETACKELNKRFFTFHQLHRPYIILKWAQTADNKIGSNSTDRLMITNEMSNRLAHRWRSEEAAILIGTNTAFADNPALTTRLWPGNSPVRLIVDMNLRLPSALHIFDKTVKTIIFNAVKHEEQENLLYYQVTEDVNLVRQMLNALYQLNIQSVLVEGGTVLLQSFIDEQLWDEARIITNTHLHAAHGLGAPQLQQAIEISADSSTGDFIRIFKPSL